MDGHGNFTEERELQRSDLLRPSDEVRRLEVMRLNDKFGK
jgi:hypothetical protein